MHRTRTIITTTAILALGVAPGAFAAEPQSPDARDANLAAQQAGRGVDLRSPDTRDAALSSSVAAHRADLRSPDTRDVADGVRFTRVPAAQVVAHEADGGFGWGDAAIGGGGVLFVVAALGTVLAVQHRRQAVTRMPGAP